MKRTILWILLACSVIGVHRTAFGQDAEELVRQMCAQTLTGSDRAEDDARLARAEQAATQVIALTEGAVPALFDYLDHSSSSYARQALVAIGPDCFPEFRKRLEGRTSGITRSKYFSAIAGMGVVAEPLVSDLLEYAEDPRTENADSVYLTLMQITSDRPAMMDRYIRYIKANADKARFDIIAELFRLQDGRELAPLIPACKAIVDAQGVTAGFKYSLGPLSAAGKEAAPLVPAVVKYWEQLDEPEGGDALYAVEFLACAGPHADSKRMVPKVEAWLTKLAAEERPNLRKVAWLSAAIACINGETSSIVPTFLHYGENFARQPDNARASLDFSYLMPIARAVSYHDPRAGARMLAPMVTYLDHKKSRSADLIYMLRRMGRLRPAVLKSVTAVMEDNSYKNAIVAQMARTRCVGLLGDYAANEPTALAALQTIAIEDPSLLVRNSALAAIRYAEKVGQKDPAQPIVSSEPTTQSTSEPPPFRTWTSANGKFTVEAMLVSADAKVATLQRKDNKQLIKVPLEKLSAVDREFIETRRSREHE